MAYEGSLLEIVLRTLTPYAVKLNGLFPEEYRIDKDKLIKVCLLHHIAKSIRLTKNDNAWEVEKRGLTYKYSENNPSIRNGLQSMMMAIECGISFDTDEVEAMTSIDRDLSDMQSRKKNDIRKRACIFLIKITFLKCKIWKIGKILLMKPLV